MSRHAITYLMIALIALQSVMAVADDYRSVQTGTEHHTVEQPLERGENASFSDARGQSAELAELSGDCCHCHGICLLLLEHGYAISMLIPLGGETIDYQISYASFRASPDNPPPIC